MLTKTSLHPADGVKALKGTRNINANCRNHSIHWLPHQYPAA